MPEVHNKETVNEAVRLLEVAAAKFKIATETLTLAEDLSAEVLARATLAVDAANQLHVRLTNLQIALREDK